MHDADAIKGSRKTVAKTIAADRGLITAARDTGQSQTANGSRDDDLKRVTRFRLSGLSLKQALISAGIAPDRAKQYASDPEFIHSVETALEGRNADLNETAMGVIERALSGEFDGKVVHSLETAKWILPLINPMFTPKSEHSISVTADPISVEAARVMQRSVLDGMHLADEVMPVVAVERSGAVLQEKKKKYSEKTEENQLPID